MKEKREDSAWVGTGTQELMVAASQPERLEAVVGYILWVLGHCGDLGIAQS